jgi:hypothetical protein
MTVISDLARRNWPLGCGGGGSVSSPTGTIIQFKEFGWYEVYFASSSLAPALLQNISIFSRPIYIFIYVVTF